MKFSHLALAAFCVVMSEAVDGTETPVAGVPGQAPPPPRETSSEDAGDDAEKKKRTRTTKPVYPGIPETGLTEVPEDYDEDKFRKLRKSDFAKESTYLRYLASQCDAIIADETKKRDQYNSQADRYEKYKDEETAKKMAAFEKSRDEIVKIKEQLLGKGLSEEELADMMKSLTS